jgi:hypothetical protein
MLNRTAGWLKSLAIVAPLALLAAGCASNEDLAAARQSAAEAQASAAQAAASAKAAQQAAETAAQNSTRSDRQFRESLRK